MLWRWIILGLLVLGASAAYVRYRQENRERQAELIGESPLIERAHADWTELVFVPADGEPCRDFSTRDKAKLSVLGFDRIRCDGPDAYVDDVR